jgi:hypothetical protein
MNYYEKKYNKYKEKYLLLKKLNKISPIQIGGNHWTIVDPEDPHLKEQETFPYNKIDFVEDYSLDFPEKKMLLWLKKKTEDILISPQEALDAKNWKATKPNGLAYWMRLYPWGNGFAEGRNVDITSQRCRELFPPNCSFLEVFESKINSYVLAQRLQINVVKQFQFLPMHTEIDFVNRHVAEWCQRGEGKLFFVLKPTSLALSEGVLIAIKNGDNWLFSVPPLALTQPWIDRFKTIEKLNAMKEYNQTDSNLSAYDVSNYWCQLHCEYKGDWIIQELLPRVKEFVNQPMEIKAYILGGNVWYAIHYVQPSTGSYLKYPFYYRKQDKSWNCIEPPLTTELVRSDRKENITPEFARILTDRLGKLVSEQIAPAAERMAKEIKVKFMMRADFFIIPDQRHIQYTDDGPVWSLDILNHDEPLNIYFNEMQHWYGKGLFDETYGNMFLYPIFQRTVNRLLRIGC